MQSDRFLGPARAVAKRDRKVFDELIGFEKAKRIRTKTRMNFTVDRNIASQFLKYCRRKGYNMSANVERAMEAMMKEDS